MIRGQETDWKGIYLGSNREKSLANRVGSSGQSHPKMEIRTRLHHYSTLLYAVPAVRIFKVLPQGLNPKTSMWQGEEVGWVRVQSFRDEGGEGIGLRSLGQSGFEQTTYSVALQSEGGPKEYLLGQSIGSLSAVSLRHLWAQPWHLSAMEFEVAWDLRGCRQYRLQSQSQWDNSRWELSELTGAALAEASRTAEGVPGGQLTEEMVQLFSRGGEALGQRRVRFDVLMPRWAVVERAQSDFLERSGLVTREALQHPVLAGIQQTVTASLSVAESEFPALAQVAAKPSGSVLVRAA